jgi:hypothetical protein
MAKLKGELLWVQQMATTWEDPVISVSKLIGHFILLDLYDISLIIKNVFLLKVSYFMPFKFHFLVLVFFSHLLLQYVQFNILLSPSM